jgi:hypothetical protein
LAEKKVVPSRVDSKLVEWVISRRERISPEDGAEDVTTLRGDNT